MKTNKVFFFGAGVLIISILLVVGAGLKSSSNALHGDLLSQIPKAWPSWEVRDLPVADTPEMKQAVEEMLNYDAAVLRQFSKDGKTILIYAAYWMPGRFHPRLISQHTPENCWVGNGMNLISSNYDSPMNLDGWATWPVQYLSFDANNHRINVAYWHLQNGRLSGYAVGPNSGSRSFIRNFLNDIRYGTGEQFFIRISGDSTLTEWEKNDLVNGILASFKPVLAASSLN